MKIVRSDLRYRWKRNAVPLSIVPRRQSKDSGNAADPGAAARRSPRASARPGESAPGGAVRGAAALGLLAAAYLPSSALGETPDFAAGRAVVVGGEDGSITPCFMCHGLDGVGDFAGAFPRLTGQAAFYLYEQLIDYASEARPHDIMTPIAREMTEPQMANVAFYYSVLAAPYARRPEVEPGVLARGRKIAEDGLPEADLQACNFCHGKDGAGDPPLFPYLAGQYAPYTELQMQLFKRGVRTNDPLGVMRDIAADLSDEDIRAVALYFEWLRAGAADGRGGAKVGAGELRPSGG
jgi:cytochrome c553